MFEIKIENSMGSVITLTQQETRFQVVDVDGLNPPKAQINRSTVAGLDGSKFNSSKLEERNIVITLRLNGNVEENRLFLYQYFRTKDYCKLYYKNNSRDVYIEGYVETVDVDYFSISEQMQISIVCPNPYFKNAQEIVDDISKAFGMFEFPFAINVGSPIEFSAIDTTRITNVKNQSESETGVIIEVNFLSSVNTLQIRNVVTNAKFTLNFAFEKSDTLIINTNKGNKSVRLIRNAVSYNLFSYIQKGSIFFQLDVGDNYFSYLVDGGENDTAVDIVFKHYTIYRGV